MTLIFFVTGSTATLTLPLGRVSLLNAYANFSIPAQAAALFPSIEGEAIERMMLAANMGQASTLTLVTKSGLALDAGAKSALPKQKCPDRKDLQSEHFFRF